MTLDLDSKQQLALDLKLEKNYDLNNFFAGENSFLIEALKQSLNKTNSFEYFYIWGDKESGKTHILKSLEKLVNNKFCYLDIEELNLDFATKTKTETKFKSKNKFLSAYLDYDFLCLDNLNKYKFANPEWELALFNLFNEYKSKGKKLVISANCAVADLPIKLADLRSRLSWGIAHKLINLSDEEKAKVLEIYAKNNFGIDLKSGIIEYILLRAPRSMEALFEILNKLAKAGIAEQKNISKPFIKQIMKW